MNIHPIKLATVILASYGMTACVWDPVQPYGYRMTSQTLPTYVNGQYVGMQPNNYAYPNSTNEVPVSNGVNVQPAPDYAYNPVYVTDPGYVNYQGYAAYPGYGMMTPGYDSGFGYWNGGIGIGIGTGYYGGGYYGGGYYGGGYGWHGHGGNGNYGNSGWRGNHSSSAGSMSHGWSGGHGGGHR